MDFERVKDIKKKHTNFLKETKEYSVNLEIIYNKLETFYNTINQLKEAFLNPNLTHQFIKFNKIFKEFSKELNLFDDTALKLIKNLQKKINENEKENIEIFNSINAYIEKEEEISKKKIECEKSTNKYSLFNIFWSNESLPDEKAFNESLKKSNKQIYQYEIDSIREDIEENGINYDKIYNETNEIINNSSEIFLPLNYFYNDIIQFSEALKFLYSNVKTQINIMNKNKEVDIKQKKENKNIIENNIKDDFLIINKEEKKDKNNDIINIIQKIINSEKKLNKKEIVEINNVLEINTSNKKKKINKDLFISEISDMCLNSIIIVKNEDNFIYLSNILNTIFLQEKTNEIFSKIISISNHIKYNNNYIYEIIIKNNKYLRTKSLWTKLIEQDLIKVINDNIKEQLNNENELKEVNSKKEKIYINPILKSLGIEKEITYEIKKLNPNQIKNLKDNIQESISALIVKYIPLMHHFLVKDQIFNEILKHYRDIFKLDNNIITYLQNLLLIHNLNSKYRKIYKSEIVHENNKISFAISEALKYLTQKEYLDLIPLNKNLHIKLKNIIFKNIIGQKNLNFHIKFLEDCLKISEIKKKLDYNNLKQKLLLYLKEDNIDPNIKKKNELIKNDLKRTLFIQNNPIHNEVIETILFTINYSFPDIGYYQGFNIIVSFLYKLLNFNEEKTFYFFYGLHFNTKYNLIFKNKFAFLNILFSVFEKIIKLNMPEILYILKNIKVDLDYFCSSWFTTLFIGNANTFNNEDSPSLLIYFIEKFCVGGWSAIFNLGLTILEIGYEKIIKLEKEELIKYIMKIINEENIFDNKNFEKCKILYEKYEKIIDEDYVELLIRIINFENENKYLINY